MAHLKKFAVVFKKFFHLIENRFCTIAFDHCGFCCFFFIFGFNRCSLVLYFVAFAHGAAMSCTAILQVVFKEAAKYKRQATIEIRALLLHRWQHICYNVHAAYTTHTDNRIFHSCSLCYAIVGLVFVFFAKISADYRCFHRPKKKNKEIVRIAGNESHVWSCCCRYCGCCWCFDNTHHIMWCIANARHSTWSNRANERLDMVKISWSVKQICD